MTRRTLSIILVFLLLRVKMCLFFQTDHQDSESGRQIVAGVETKISDSSSKCAQVVNRTYRTSQILCDGRQFLEFPGDQESFLKVYKKQSEPGSTSVWHWEGRLRVPKEKFISLKISPFETPGSPCKDLFATMHVVTEERSVHVNPCDRSAMLFHSSARWVLCFLSFFKRFEQQFSVTIAVRALAQDGAKHLNVYQQTKLSGTVTPYGFDGFTVYAADMEADTQLEQPHGHSVMLSFPHFHIGASGRCYLDRLVLMADSKFPWTRCGVHQLPPEVHKYYKVLSLKFSILNKKGYTGFQVRFSFHGPSEVPEKLSTDDPTTAVFNCSVSFYNKFSQHLECNLDKECFYGEDEASCPYSQGLCAPGFLHSGTKCYKYIKTRTRMTWYDASSLCSKQGLTLASFPTYKEGEHFRNNILRFAPITFNTFIGLRTSDPLLPSIYRQVWQWSTGVMAFYVYIEQRQMFKPTCASFAAFDREKISTTMCGFYEHMQYIFCETGTLYGHNNRSHTTNLPPTAIKSSFTLAEYTRFVTCSEGHATHNFLSCDHLSQCDAELGLMSCVTHNSNTSSERSVEVLMYVCDSQTQTIHYTLVCDHQAQCLDSSDESFCIHPTCSEKQCLNQQCVKAAEWCDGKKHCSDGSDEDCPQFVTGSDKPFNTSTSGFHVVLFDGGDKYEYIHQGSKFPGCPTTHFLCANRQLCLPVFLRCNGVYDCADREDEHNCASVTCPGFYRCRQSKVCVHPDHVCDGVFQCPQEDDELLCQQVCPDSCLCQGLAFVCPHPFPVQDHADLRYLDSSKSGLAPDKLVHNHYLIRLVLSECALRSLTLFDLPNLKFLDLSNNLLRNVSMQAFLKLSNLNFLGLSRNPLHYIVAPVSTAVLESVHTLDLSETRLTYFDCSIFWNIHTLKQLNLSHSMLNVISSRGFAPLTQIESLDLRGNELRDYPVKMLQSLTSLQMVFSDIFKLCCHDILPREFNPQSCHTSQDEISSCSDMLRSDVYRIFLWISCCFALIGNSLSFAAKLYMQKGTPRTSFNVFIAHLNVADFFMGLYLAVVGCADQVYRGTYLWHDEEWKTSACCKAAGFFSLLSCEMSAFIICFVTLDRFLVMRFPWSQLRFRNTSAQVVCGVSWVVGFSLAALPLLPLVSHWEFYSLTGICIPLPVTRQTFKGHFYAFGIFIVLNFFLFVLIAAGQTLIYLSVRNNSMTMDQKRQFETTVARRLLTVVMSDFLCWFPIGLLGLLASSGVPIPGEVNVALAIFAMPLNSALNPFLYTFNLLMEKRRKASEQRLLKILKARYSD